MNIDDQKIKDLRAEVRAALQEFNMAIAFHEVWKPAAYDKSLHERMGVSLATNAFHVVQAALRREMLLAFNVTLGPTRYFMALAAALATCPSCWGSIPETPTAPTSLPSMRIGTPPS